MPGGRAAPLERSAAGGRSPWLIAGIISIATFMEVLDTSIANVSLRHIAGSLAAGEEESTWVLTSYLVANAVILPISGWLSGVVGRKRFYMLCVALFTASSVACALAPSLPLLILFRVLQGLGGGGLAPSEQSMLADTFPPEQRGQAFSVYGIAVIVAPTIGPTLGGWITDNYSWHWIFLINLPMGLLSLALVGLFVVEPKVLQDERRQRISQGIKVDYVGFGLVALFLGSLEIVLDKGQTEDWFSSSFIITFTALSALGLLLLIPWELSRKDPIVDIALLGRRSFGIAFLVMLTVGGILFGSTQILPQLLQTSFGYTATWAGLALMPGGAVMLVIMPLVGVLMKYLPPKYMILFGLCCCAASLYHFTSLSPTSSYWTFAWSRALQTVGLPFLFVPITTVSYAGLPPEKTGQASSLINVARNIGGSMGVATVQTVLARRSQVHQTYLGEHVSAASQTYRDTLDQAIRHFESLGSTAAQARQQAIGWIGKTVTSQASFLAYIDAFLVMALIAACVAPLALLLPGKKAGGEGEAAGG